MVMEVRHLLPRLIVVMDERTKLTAETEPREFTCNMNVKDTETTVPPHRVWKRRHWKSAVIHSPKDGVGMLFGASKRQCGHGSEPSLHIA